MSAGAQHVPAFLIGQNAAHGQSPGNALGEGRHVRQNAVLLEGEEAARPPYAGLDLVHQQQPVLLRAQSGNGLHIVTVQGQHAALALDQLHHDGTHVVPRRGLQGGKVVGVGIPEPLGEGEEIVVEHVLAGGRQGGDGAAVEGVVQSDDGGTAPAVLVEAVLSRQLNHALVGLAAAVGEEYAAHAGPLAEDLRQPGRWLGVEQVGGVADLPRLLGDGVHPGLTAIAQIADADADGEVDVGVALGVVERGALSMVDGHREAAVSVHDVLPGQGLDLLAGHGISPPFSTWCRCPHH